MNRRKLAFDAATSALQLRQSVGGIPPYNAICPYDFAQKLGVEVRFFDLPSMEGMYCKRPEPLIVVSSLRPRGRQAFTCGHEIGHHIYKHGARIDELSDETRNSNTVEELQANFFSSFLLMPKLAVSRAFTRRGWSTDTCTAVQVYTIAEWLGVGYTTLIWHMSTSLNLMPTTLADALLKVQPKQIRATILGEPIQRHLVVVDTQWEGRAIDAQVGDLILLPPGTLNEGANVSLLNESPAGSLYEAVAQGVGRLFNPVNEWVAFIRVAKKNFVGRSIYRHLEDCPDGDD